MNIIPYDYKDAELINKCPCEFRKARFMQPLLKGYYVTLYCIFDGEKVYHFFHQSEMLDNALLGREAGYSLTEFKYTILVTPDKHPEIFNEIEDYVSLSNKD